MPWHRSRELARDKPSRLVFPPHIFNSSVRNFQQTYDLGHFDPSFAALKRARNKDHGATRARDLLPHPPAPRRRSRKTLAPKRGALFAPLAHRARPFVIRGPTGDREADTRQH